MSELENDKEFQDFIGITFESPKIYNLKEKNFKIELKEDKKNKGKFIIEISWKSGKYEPFLKNVGTEELSKEDVLKLINKFLKENL